MTRRGAVLATGLGALVIGVAGCGGGGGSAVGTTSGGMTATAGMTTTGGTTTTSRGGVLGVQANIDEQQLQGQANRIEAMLLGQLSQLRNASSSQDLAATAKSARTQVLKAANRLDRLDLQSQKAQQQRGHLESALRSLAADLTTVQGDTRSGNLQKALTDLGNLSSVTAVQQSLQSIQRSGTSAGDRQALRSQATSIAATLQSRLIGLAGVNDPQTFAKRTESLQRFLDRHDQKVENLSVPQSQQQRKQALVGFLHDWETTLNAAHEKAANGNLKQAKQQLRQGSLDDLEGLLGSLTSSS